MQYVGARYVPKFMGLYDATQAYEALCVVDNGMGTSYITKVPTPAGAPLTDTDYYAVYGASSGAIINLQNQINTLTDHVNVRFVTPEMYGAVGDGVTDDTTAIQSMINSGDSNYFLLLNNYKVSDKIVLPSNIVIDGGNKGEIIDNWLITTPDLTEMYYGIFDATNKENILITNLTIKGNTLGAVQSSTRYFRTDISFHNCENIKIENCRFIECDLFTQISTNHCKHVYVKDNVFEWYRQQGVSVTSSEDVVIDGNSFIDCGCDHSNTYGISITYLDPNHPEDNCNKVVITNNMLSYPNNTANWDSIGAHGCRNAIVSGNIIINGRYAIAFDSEAARNYLCKDITIKDNLIYNAETNVYTDTRAIMIGGTNCNVSDNEIYNSGADFAIGIRVQGLAENINISNNQMNNIKGNCFFFSMDYSAFTFPYLHNVIVNDNVCTNCIAETGANKPYVILFQNKASIQTGRNVIFKNNTFSNYDKTQRFFAILPTTLHDGDTENAILFEDNTYMQDPSFDSYAASIPDCVSSAFVSSLIRGRTGHMIKVYNAAAGDTALLIDNGSAYIEIKCAP